MGLTEKTVKTLLLFLSIILSSAIYCQQSPAPQLNVIARQHYSDMQVSQMTPLQIAQINFIYTQSFLLNTEKPCADCPAIDLTQFDVALYERHKSTRARVYLSVPGHPVDLLSYDELDIELQRIADEFNSTSTQH